MTLRRGAGAVERGSLENCWPFTGPVSSNLTPAALRSTCVTSAGRPQVVALRGICRTHCRFIGEERTSGKRPNLPRPLTRCIRSEIPAAASARPVRPLHSGADGRLGCIGSRRPAATSSATDYAPDDDKPPDGDGADGDCAAGAAGATGAASAEGSTAAAGSGGHAAVLAASSVPTRIRRERIGQRRRGNRWGNRRGIERRRGSGCRRGRRQELRRKHSAAACWGDPGASTPPPPGPRLDRDQRAEEAAADHARVRAAQAGGHRVRRRPGIAGLPPHRAVPRAGPSRRQPHPARRTHRTPLAQAGHLQVHRARGPGWSDGGRHAARRRPTHEPKRDPSGPGRQHVPASRPLRQRLELGSDRPGGRRSFGSRFGGSWARQDRGARTAPRRPRSEVRQAGALGCGSHPALASDPFWARRGPARGRCAAPESQAGGPHRIARLRPDGRSGPPRGHDRLRPALRAERQAARRASSSRSSASRSSASSSI